MSDTGFTDKKFPSEEQGGYDPIPTHPEPNNPAHTTSHPEEEPLPDDEDINPGQSLPPDQR